jgi:3-oxoacyl-(acyl-carrier-protein) synthase/pimeloyl-ACP methyl ester carboxylesterase/acyl carrier protein
VKNEYRVFEQTLRHGNFIVRDHHVHDVRTLPGVALLDMIYRLAPRCLGTEDAVELRKVIFKQPIVTSEEFDKQIVVTFSPIESHWQVSVASYGCREGQRLDGVTTENMECTLHRVQGDGPVRMLDVDAFIRNAEYDVDMDQVYGLALRANIRHYSFMKTLGRVYARGSRELMRLRLGNEAEKFREKFQAHPALLDGSTFAGQSIRVRDPAFDEDRTPYIPFTINRFRIYKPFPKEIFTYSDNEAFWTRAGGPIPDVNITDVAVFDGTGQLLAEFDKISMKRIRSAQSITGLIASGQGPTRASPRPALEAADPEAAGVPAHARAEQPSDIAQPTLVEFIQQEIATALHRRPDELSMTDNFYDLGMDSSQLLQLTKRVETAIGRELYPTLLFEYPSIETLAAHLGNELVVATMRPSGPDDGLRQEPAAAAEADGSVLVFSPYQLEQELDVSHGQLQLQLPVHVVCVADGPPGPWDSAMVAALGPSANSEGVVIIRPVGAAFADRAEDLVARLVCHIKELVSRQIGRDIVLQLVASSEGGRSWAAPCSGCLKTLSMEHPRIRSQIFLVDDLMEISPETVAAMMQREAAAARKGTVCVTYSQRLARRRVNVLREVEYNAAGDAYSFRDRGTYVIAGGLGGLGLIVADHLAARCRPRLALLGRSALDDEGRRHIERLTRQGAEVVHYQVDLTDLAMLETVHARIRETLGPVAGIVHSAGIVKDQVIGRKDTDDVRRIIGSKVTGLSNLDFVSKDEQLDFFLMFSSLSAITGNIGQVDYAAANSFMDEFAFHRRRLESTGARHGRTVSINWPLWAQGGMAIDGLIERRLYQSSGLHPLPAAAGVEIMNWALRNGEAQTVVAYGTASKIRSYMTAQGLTLTSLDDDGASDLTEDAVDRIGSKRRRNSRSGAIAIIGLAGRYPMANDVEAFYRNLKSGKNCISSIPLERWQGHDFGYNPKDYYRYGGFLDRIDQFDPRLFGIPPIRAQLMDPQARLFLETAWHACEDAGFYQDRTSQNYRASGKMSVGVFVGAFWSHYELFGAENTVRGVPTSLGVSLSSISNTTSYCMNFHGPSVAMDTMCSSALTAIHMACESLRSGECHYAVAGGVNLVAHPHKFIFLQENHFLSSQGECRTFGVDGDGYVPGEGVGAVLLTDLERAQELGYPIRAVIRGTAVNHSGKTAGGTVPNPVAQSEVIADALTAAAMDPRTLGYVEAHGTGTSLGDPIEIDGLTKAFRRWTSDKQFCAIGSSKSNIGHCEAAAGIAGLTKLVLQLEHGEIFPSLHAETLNPFIPFESSPFHVQTRLRPWDRTATDGVESSGTSARRALISSFGASGSNASLVVEEYVPADHEKGPEDVPVEKAVAIALSARDPDRLVELTNRLLASIRQRSFSEAQLQSIAYTLQVGREPMDERLAFVVRSLGELEQKLAAFLADPASAQGVYRGKASRKAGAASKLSGVTDDTDDRLAGLLARWVEGASVDWNQLYGVRKPKRVHLPGYPFARQRYWVPDAPGLPVRAVSVGGTTQSAEPQALAQKQEVSPPRRDHRTLRKSEDVRAVSPLQHVPSKLSLAPLQDGAVGTLAPAAPVKTAVQLHEPLAAIQQSLVGGLAKALFIEPAEIDFDVPFTEIGLDSIIAVQWMKAVSAEFGTALPAKLLYEFPTIRLLAACVAAAMQSVSGTAAAESAEHGGEDLQREATRAADEIERSLLASLSAILFMEPDQIRADASFAEIGLDSVVAVQWMKAINAKFDASFQATVIYQYPTLQLLARHLAAELAHGAVGPGSAPAASLAQAAVDPPPGVCAAAGTGHIVDFLRQSLATAMFMECEEIDEGTVFTEYGLDSIIAIQWIKAVNTEYDTSIKASALYEYPTVSALAQHLVGQLASAPSSPGAAERELPEAKSVASRSLPGQAGAQPDGSESRTSDDLAYALAGCIDSQITLVEVSPGCWLEMVAAGRGPPVVLLPPMGALATAWMHQFRELSKHYRVMAFHYPGHGNTPFNAYETTFERIAVGVLSAVIQSGIEERMHLVGWSMGALVSQAIVLRSPERVKSLTLIGAPASVSDGGDLEATITGLSNLMKDFAENVPEAARDARESDFDFIKAAAFVPNISIPYLEEMLAFDYPRAAEISVPTLVVFGSRDQVISPDHGIALADMIHDSRGHANDSGGHYIPLQNHAWFNERLAEFFREVERRTNPALAELESA